MKLRIQRAGRVLLAFFQAHYYLLTSGMWRGEQLATHTTKGQITWIAAVNSKVHSAFGGIQICRTFFQEPYID